MKLQRDRTITRPAGYAERRCLLVSYRLPGLPHCHTLCREAGAEVETDAQTLAFFFTETERLAFEATGDRQSFVLVHSGRSVRKRTSLHLHVFITRTRWQKAWVYTVLSAKNLAQCARGWVAKPLGGRAPSASGSA